MKYMLLMNHTAAGTEPPFETWTAADIQTIGAHMEQIRQNLVESGELLGARGWPTRVRRRS